MKEMIITVIALVVCAAFIGHLEISLSPFSVRLPLWHRVVCMVLLVITYIVWNFGERSDAYSKGLKEGMKITIEQLRNNGNK